MFYAGLVILCLLTIGSAYFFMRSLQEAKKKQEMFFSEILPFIKDANITENKDFFPALDGYFENIPIKIVPLADNLCYRGLPRLYIRIYILIKNEQLLRVANVDERKHLFPPASFEKFSFLLKNNKPNYEIFLPDRFRVFDEGSFTRILAEIKDCSEILFHKNFIRLTLLLARGERGHYAVLRSVKFPILVLKYEQFKRNIKMVLELRKEVAKIDKAS